MVYTSRSMRATRVAVVFLGVAVLACAVAAPWLVRFYMTHTGKGESLYVPLLLTLYLTAVLAAAILWLLYRLLSRCCQGEVFSEHNIGTLRLLSYLCFAVAVLYLAVGWWFMLGFAVAVAAAFMGLILRTVKNVFETAYRIKQENDLTI